MSLRAASPESGTDRLRRFGWPLAILVLGLALRVVYSVQFKGHPLGKLPWVDEGAYWTRALEILDGAWLPDRPFYQDPLHAYLLAGLMRVFGSDVGTLRVILACIGALTPLAVYAAGVRGFGRAEGVVAGILCAVCGPLIFADGLLEKEGLAALGAASALALTAIAVDPRAGAWWPSAAGLAWGLVTLLRANVLALAPMGAIYWRRADAVRVSARNRRARAASFLLGFAMAIAPVSIVNALVSKPRELILTTWQGGANFYIGNGPEATGTYAAPEFVLANPAREADDYAAEAVRRAGHPLSYSAVSRFWLRLGLKRWRDAPGASLALLVHKLGLVLHDFEIPDNHDLEFVRVVAAPVLHLGVVGFGVLLPLAMLAPARAERTPFLGFLVLATVTGLVSTALFFVVGRYRTPWIPGLALLAAAGAVDLFRRLADRRWRGAAWRILVLAAPAAAVAWRPMPDPTPHRWGHSQIALGLAYMAEGSLEPAIDAFDDARAIGAGPAIRIEALLADPGPRERIAWLVQTRLGLSRGDAGDSTLVRARWLRQLPETRAESRALLESLLRARPGDPAILREWGAWWLGELSEPDARQRARSALVRASNFPGADPSARVLLALLDRDPGLLENSANLSQLRSHHRAALARAILMSRKGVGFRVD